MINNITNKEEEILKIIKKYENNDDIFVVRFLNEKNKSIIHYKINNEIVMTVINDNKIVKTIRTDDKGVNLLNGRTQIDGQKYPNELNKTNSNKKHVKGLIENVFFNGVYNNKELMKNYINENKYLQHNMDNKIGDGLSELLRSVDIMHTYESDLKYDEIEECIGEEDMVFTISIQNWLNPNTKEIEIWEYFDIFRVEDNLIVEHWDILGRRK